LYVDDLIFIEDISIDDFKTSMKIEFEMIYLGMMKYFLGIEINQSKDDIFIFKTKNEKYILKRFRMVNCKPVLTPIVTGTKISKKDEGSYVDSNLYKRLVESRMYLIATILDIMFVVIFISILMETLKSTHCQEGKRILRSFLGTTNYGI